MARVKGKVSAKARKVGKSPVKSGSTNRGGDGGIFVAKTIAIVKKTKGINKE